MPKFAKLSKIVQFAIEKNMKVIISKEKRNIGQLIGPIDWSKKEVEDLFIELIEKES